MQKGTDVLLLRLDDLYLCPGDEAGCHVTNSSTACNCGNSNLVSLAKILDREPTSERFYLEILERQHPDLKDTLTNIKRLFKA